MSRPYLAGVGVHATGTGNVTPALPVGWREKYVFVLAVQSANQAASAPDVTWTAIGNSPQGTGTAGAVGSTRITGFWKRATSSESAPTVADTGDHTLAQIFAFADCIETGDPFDATAGDVEAVASTTVTFPGLTTTVDLALVVNLLGHSEFGGTTENTAVTNADLLNPETRAEVSVQTGVDGGLLLATGLKATAGAVGSSTLTLTGAGAAQGRLTFALKPRVSTRPYVLSHGALTSGTGAISPAVPPGYAAGDTFVMPVESANQAIAAPAGWNEFTNSPQGTGAAGAAGGVRLGAFWRIATASESAPTIADTGDHTGAQIICIRGADPAEATAGDVEASASTTATFPGVTTLGDERLLLHLLAHDTDALTSRRVSGWSNSTLQFVAEVTDDVYATASGGGLAIAAGGMNTAGAIGSTTATLLSSVVQGRMTLAFPPAAAQAFVPRAVIV
jgi:hypothetical protein